MPWVSGTFCSSSPSACFPLVKTEASTVAAWGQGICPVLWQCQPTCLALGVECPRLLLKPPYILHPLEVLSHPEKRSKEPLALVNPPGESLLLHLLLPILATPSCPPCWHRLLRDAMVARATTEGAGGSPSSRPSSESLAWATLTSTSAASSEGLGFPQTQISEACLSVNTPGDPAMECVSSAFSLLQ